LGGGGGRIPQFSQKMRSSFYRKFTVAGGWDETEITSGGRTFEGKGKVPPWEKKGIYD